MTDQVHPHWGRVNDVYDSTYIYKESVPRHTSSCSHTLYADVAETLHKLCALGESSVNYNWENNANPITLSNLKAFVQHVSTFPCFLTRMSNPPLINGCIKLMKSITRFGRSSPFSYEYGHLCFRILVVAFDFSTLVLSDRYESWVEEIDEAQCDDLQADHISMLSKAAFEVIVGCLSGGTQLYNQFVAPLPWTDSYTGPLVTKESIRLLARLLDDDRKHFLIFLRSNYSLRISTILYTMLQHMHRTPPTPENQPYVQAFIRIYPRALLVAPGCPFGPASMHRYVMMVSGSYESTRSLLGVEDSKLVLRAYVDRLTTLSGTTLHPRATSTLAIDLLQYAQPLIHDGCEALIPPVIRATVRCMASDLADGEFQINSQIDKFMQLLGSIQELFEFLVERAELVRNTLDEAMDVILEEELANLVTRILLEIPPTEEDLLDEDGPTESLIEAATSIFHVLEGAVPPADLQHRFGEDYLHIFGLDALQD